MKKEVFEIDINGYIVEKYVTEFNEQGNCLEEIAENIITVQPSNSLYRAKWNGTEWIEDMSQQEIDAIINQRTEPTEIEQLRLEQAQSNAEMIDLMMAMMGGI